MYVFITSFWVVSGFISIYKTPTEVSVFYQKISNSASMKYYAVIDTNVLVSAMLKHDSVPGSIIDRMITPVMNNR